MSRRTPKSSDTGVAWFGVAPAALQPLDRDVAAAELADLIGAGHTVYPIDLPDLLGALQPWDGRVRVLEEQN